MWKAVEENVYQISPHFRVNNYLGTLLKLCWSHQLPYAVTPCLVGLSLCSILNFIKGCLIKSMVLIRILNICLLQMYVNFVKTLDHVKVLFRDFITTIEGWSVVNLHMEVVKETPIISLQNTAATKLAAKVNKQTDWLRIIYRRTRVGFIANEITSHKRLNKWRSS